MGKRLPFLGVITVALAMSGCSNNPNPQKWNAEDSYFLVKNADVISFDPSISYNAGDAPMMDPIYPSYYRFGYLHQNPWTLELNIGLTEPKREEIRGTLHTEKGDTPYTGEKWTFELRHDIRFQDDPCFLGGKGRNVTAKDMEYAFKRLDDPKIEFPLESNLADKVLGWEEYRKGFEKEKRGKSNYDQPLRGFEIDPNNPYRFSVSFNQKYPQFRFLMVMHFTTPLAREAVEMYGDKFAIDHPVGCGPYQMAEYIPHRRMVIVPNPNNTFWRYPTTAGPETKPELLAEAGKPLPFTKRIVFTTIIEDVTAYNMFEQGYLDTWGIGPGNAQQMLSAIRPGSTMTARGVKMDAGAYPSVYYCGFNMLDPIFGGYTPEKRKLRQAISLSIDSQQYIDLLNQGIGSKAEFVVPRGLGGYDAKYINPYRIYDPKLKRAKELLAEAGYPGGRDSKTGERLVLTLDNSTQSPVDRERGAFLTKEIESIGIKVNLSEESAPAFSDKVIHGKVQFFQYGWIADYPDAENFLMLMYGGYSPNPQDPNDVHYERKEYDQLFDQMRNMDDGAEREAIMHKMRDLAVEDCPWIYLYEAQAPSAFQPWVKNQLSNPILSDGLVYRDVDVERREKLQREWNSPILGPLAILFGVTVLVTVPAVATVRRQRNRRVRRAVDPKGGQD